MRTRRTRLACLPLERRDTPAVLELTVDTDLDVADPADGLTSLREAIDTATAQTTHDSTTIRFAPALRGARIVSLSAGGSAHGSAAFELLNSRPVQIEGSGQKLDRAGAISMRLFTVGPGVALGLRNLELLNGWASAGGAVYNLGTFTATGCTFADNTVFRYGSNAYGGAIYNGAGSVTLDTCTLTGNRTLYGIHKLILRGGYGGGIYNEDGSLTLKYVTVADNTSGDGQQVYSTQNTGTASVHIDHSILSQVPAADTALVVTHAGSSGVGNLVRGFTGFAGQVILTADPLLQPLADNGGPTRTRGLAADSPAVNAGELFFDRLFDQTGASRSVGTFTDLGAFEFRGASTRPAPPVVVGSGPGVPSQVRRFDTGGNVVDSFAPFDPAFTGGVRVAKADFNRDGVPDVVAAAGPGGGPHVRVFDGATGGQLLSVFAFAPGFAGGVSVAAADLTGDGIADLICGAGAGGGPHVRVLDGASGAEVRGFFAFDPAFTGGVSVAYSDGWIVTGAGAGGGPHVKAFDAATGAEVRSFMAFDPAFRGGVSVAVGDVNHLPHVREPNLLAGAGPGGGPSVRMFDGRTGALQQDWPAFDPTNRGGVSVAMGDVTGDGQLDLVVGSGPGDPPRVRVLRGQTATEELAFTPFADPYRSGVFVG